MVCLDDKFFAVEGLYFETVLFLVLDGFVAGRLSIEGLVVDRLSVEGLMADGLSVETVFFVSFF